MLKQREQYKKDQQAANKLYRSVFSKDINWIKPTGFNEKLHIFKITKEAEELAPYADKFEVRSFVKKTVGSRYLTTLYDVYNRVEDIDLNKLPNAFILKATHGSGWNIACQDKRMLNWKLAKKKLSAWLKRNYYESGQERQYRNIKPRILCEEYLSPKKGTLKDYKLFCFAGKPVLIEVVVDRQIRRIKRYFYDQHWNRVHVSSADVREIPRKDSNIERPKRLKEILSVAARLSAPFRHVRVDLYYVDDRIYFGELTFTTANGTYIFKPKSYDQVLGAHFNIEKLRID